MINKRNKLIPHYFGLKGYGKRSTQSFPAFTGRPPVTPQ